MERPKLGLGVLIRHQGKILFGKRKNAHGGDTWCPPGGHLEFGESFEEGARRETEEEAGITIKNITYCGVTNDIFEHEQKHYVTIFLVADLESGEPVVKEPDKCDGWEWLDWNNLPENIFLSELNLKKQGADPFKI